MNITYLIGNGFDLNLGLKTSYTDFFTCYKETNEGDVKEVIELSPMEYIRQQRIFRQEFLGYGESLDQNQAKSIGERIFLTGANVFECLTDYVKKKDELNA